MALIAARANLTQNPFLTLRVMSTSMLGTPERPTWPHSGADLDSLTVWKTDAAVHHEP
jgi:hypothetical protein